MTENVTKYDKAHSYKRLYNSYKNHTRIFIRDYWYNEQGTFTLTHPIVMHGGAKLSSDVITTVPAGSTIKYDSFSYQDGYVWLRQQRSDGSYGYLPSGHSSDDKQLDYWGKFSK